MTAVVLGVGMSALVGLFFGIYLEKSNNGKVLNNTIIGDAVNEYNSGNGIQLWYCKNVEVAGNTVRKVRDGIYLEFSDEIESWVIQELKKTGLDTAKSVLALTREDLIRRTELEEETIDEIFRILRQEFEQ